MFVWYTPVYKAIPIAIINPTKKMMLGDAIVSKYV